MGTQKAVPGGQIWVLSTKARLWLGRCRFRAVSAFWSFCPPGILPLLPAGEQWPRIGFTKKDSDLCPPRQGRGSQPEDRPEDNRYSYKSVARGVRAR